ncbi:MAG TPA: Asp-tRNA(Asn)/Glu-tRNA(Gln) amidotransferase subunit GatC [Thermodesulfovibrionales bacterium]|nr:Asp-tRNA(Asn)/Glu-tRNA(Gln) amidotransferase subunit GatC [Thermodesulfovibrionales bacterium]
MKLDVEHIAQLARLALTDAEKERFATQLASILSYVGKLRELDTSGIEPTSHVVTISNVVREDRVSTSLTKDIALMNAPDRAGDFYRVPKIIE